MHNFTWHFKDMLLASNNVLYLLCCHCVLNDSCFLCLCVFCLSVYFIISFTWYGPYGLMQIKWMNEWMNNFTFHSYILIGSCACISHKCLRCPNLPWPAVCHQFLTSPTQYVLSVPEAFSQWVSWVFSEGRPVWVKTANDPPRDKHSLLALNHVTRLGLSNFL